MVSESFRIVALDDWKMLFGQMSHDSDKKKAGGRIRVWCIPLRGDGSKMLTRHCARWWWFYHYAACNQVIMSTDVLFALASSEEGLWDCADPPHKQENFKKNYIPCLFLTFAA
ncbi:hypothetical protein TNCV_2824111 [Trichonephila clavipes]|nr:hypothetical protein TNCV_2824111 [Trichonephila clavipes]